MIKTVGVHGGSLVVEADQEISPLLREGLELAKVNLAASRSQNTIFKYQNDWNRFVAWCDEANCKSLPCPPEVMCAYVSLLDVKEGLKTSTIRRHAAAIAWVHDNAGHTSPTSSKVFKAVMSGMAKRKADAAARGKKAILSRDLLAMVEGLDNSPGEIRDKALMLIGFSTAMRRSELVNIQFEDIEWVGDKGIKIWVGKAKGDQTGKGSECFVYRGEETCPVASLEDWLDVSGITSGYIFRRLFRNGSHKNEPISDGYVGKLLKRHAEKAGLSKSDVSGHSLRRGFATQSLRNGKGIEEVQKHLRHKSRLTTEGYIEPHVDEGAHPGHNLLDT